MIIPVVLLTAFTVAAWAVRLRSRRDSDARLGQMSAQWIAEQHAVHS